MNTDNKNITIEFMYVNKKLVVLNANYLNQ